MVIAPKSRGVRMRSCKKSSGSSTRWIACLWKPIMLWGVGRPIVYCYPRFALYQIKIYILSPPLPIGQELCVSQAPCPQTLGWIKYGQKTCPYIIMYKSVFCTLETCTLHNTLFEGKKKLKESDENPNYTYFDKQCDQIFLLHIYIYICFTNDSMCM